MGKYDFKGVRDQQPENKAQAVQSVTTQPAKASNGREPGKRSRPDYSRTTIYMRDDTKLRAVRLLQDLKDERDFSDLIESLVSDWTSKHSNA